MLEPFARGAVGDPILLVLLKLLQPFQHDDECAGAPNQPGGADAPAATGIAAAVTIWQTLTTLNQRWLRRLFASYQAI